MTGKIPPHSIDLEKAVLGAVLLDKNCLYTIMPIVTADSFYHEGHEAIYRAILSLHDKRKPIDLLTVTESLRASKELELAGGAYYITELTNQIASSAHSETHARILAEFAIKRKIIEIAGDALKAGYDDQQDAFDLMDNMERQLLQITESLNGQGSTPDISELIAERIGKLSEIAKSENDLTGIPTGFKRMDELTGGWQKTDLIVIAARPGMGKSALMLTTANAGNRAGHKIAIASVEMDKYQLVDRELSMCARVDLQTIRNPKKLTSVEWGRMTGIGKTGIKINDTAQIPLRQLHLWAKEMVKKDGCTMLIVDYLQIMGDMHNGKESREQEVSRISRGLKGVAKDLQIPVIALSQLSRNPESRSDKRPILSDLRESGAIEQDADMVVFLYRDEYYGITGDENGNSTIGVAELIIAKNRQGPLGTVRVNWEGRFTNFQDFNHGFSPINQSNGKETPF